MAAAAGWRRLTCRWGGGGEVCVCGGGGGGAAWVKGGDDNQAHAGGTQVQASAGSKCVHCGGKACAHSGTDPPACASCPKPADCGRGAQGGLVGAKLAGASEEALAVLRLLVPALVDGGAHPRHPHSSACTPGCLAADVPGFQPHGSSPAQQLLSCCPPPSSGWRRRWRRPSCSRRPPSSSIVRPS